MNFSKKQILIILLIFVCTSISNAQWVRDFGSDTYVMQNVSMVDTGTIWFLGYQSIYPFDTTITIRKTTQFGWDVNFWNDLPTRTIFTSIAGINKDTVFIGSEYGKLYKCTNAGYNWIEILNTGDTTYVVTAVKFSKQQKNTGYVFCSRPYGPSGFIIYKTTDFGETWQDLTPNLGSSYYGNTACVTDSAHVWYGLNCYSNNCTAKIAYTSNGGINWSTFNLDPGRRACTSVTFKSDNLNGLAFSHLNGTPEKLMKSVNSGANWTFDYNFPTDFVTSGLISIPGSTVWYLGGNGDDSANTFTHIYKSTDEGIHWSDMSFDTDPNMILDLDAIKLDGKIYAWATAAGGMFKLVDTAVVIGIKNNGSFIPGVYSIEQNYPNPFNPETKIKYGLPKSGNVNISVYDILGREISVIVNEFKIAGNYEIIFNGSQLASGIYIYKISAGDFSESKKMVLIK